MARNLSPAKRGRAVDHVCEVMGVSERRACQVLGQPRSTQRHVRKVPEDEERRVSQIVSLATRSGRHGYRRITGLLQNDGREVNHKMHVSRRIRSEDILEQLLELFLTRGIPEHIRSDNGAEFTANAVRNWLEERGGRFRSSGRTFRPGVFLTRTARSNRPH